jgi:hypothetical protein
MNQSESTLSRLHTYDTVVEGIADPVEEGLGRKEVILLPELI